MQEDYIHQGPWVCWVEPFTEDCSPVFMRASRETVIKAQKEKAAKLGRTYSSDEEAFWDFMAVYWAREITKAMDDQPIPTENRMVLP